MIIKNFLQISVALLFFWLAVSSAVDDSPTMDEQNHIARGIAYLSTGDPRLSMEHPPLVNAISALPLLTLDLDLDLPTDTPAWERDPILFYWYIFAEELIWERNQALTDQIYFLGRVPIILLTLLFAAVTGRLTRKIYGETPALVAFSLVLLDPTVMAHGRYSTTDLGGAFFLLIATYTLITRFRKPLKPIHIPLLALTLACAFGSKLSNLGFAPIYALIALLPLHTTANTTPKRLIYLIVSGLSSIVFLWAIFGFEYGQYIFLWERLTFLNQWSGPLPTFLAGIERIAVATSNGRASYLMGDFSPNGFPLYFPLAFLFKTPILTLILTVVGTRLAVSLLAVSLQRRTPIILIILIIYYFLFVTRSGLNIGYRHLMPILPLIYVIGAGAVTKLPKFAPYTIITIALFVNLTTYPHYLSFFNTFAGGTEGGRDLLIDSNIDWGQDLNRLNDWMSEKGVESVNLSYFGTADIGKYVTYTPLPSFPRHLDLWFTDSFDHTNPAPGIYVISAHNLQEMPHNDPANKTVFAYFREREPDDSIGGSLLIYRIRP